ncbi:MAG: hypothetical protein JXR96_20810 [Deltaproteobacteria bacterium]|nr:hypothetical protein [Deltaproteobacteria bacterium]
MASMRGAVYIPVWFFDYAQLDDDEPRLVDILPDRKELSTGNLAVYMRYSIDLSAGTPRAVYTGDYLVRRIAQVLRGFAGVSEHMAVVMLKKIWLRPRVRRQIARGVELARSHPGFRPAIQRLERDRRPVCRLFKLPGSPDL